MSYDVMFDMGSELENLRVEYSRIFDMLSIYGEGINECMECLRDCGDGMARYIALRLDKYQSMLEIISIHMGEAETSLQAQIDKAYSLCREGKANRKQT